MCPLVLFLFYCGLLNSYPLNSGHVAVRALEAADIIGGHEALLGKYPYHVAIEVFGAFVCGGGIVGEYFVLTAAHCVTDDKGLTRLPVKVVGGINDLAKVSSKTSVVVSVQKIYIPRKFSMSEKVSHIASDIAVLKLEKPLGLASSRGMLGKLKLPPSESFAGDPATITGFGWNWVNVRLDKKTGEVDEKGGTYAKLRYAESQIVSNEACQKRYIKKIIDSHICARVVPDLGNEGVCSGDSGGPLVHNGDTLIGIVSSSPVGCAEASRPAIYTRVSSFRSFIYAAMLDLTSSDILTIKPVIMPSSRA